MKKQLFCHFPLSIEGSIRNSQIPLDDLFFLNCIIFPSHLTQSFTHINRISLYNLVPRSAVFLSVKKDIIFLLMHAEVLLQKLWDGGLYLKATFYSQMQRGFTMEVKCLRESIKIPSSYCRIQLKQVK